MLASSKVLESDFPDIAEGQPELLARHCTEALLTEKAAKQWGKAGLRSLERSALVEAIKQLSQALSQIETLPSTPALRREQINFQVALITPLIHVKGYAAPETRAAAERGRQLIEQAEALGEPAEDPLLLFSVLHSLWVAKFTAFNGDAVRELALEFLALAEKQGATAPLLIAHRIMGPTLLCLGDVTKARAYYDQAIALYNPAEHRALATGFGVDSEVSFLSWRAWASWMLGYPDVALADITRALKVAREIGHAATLMYALGFTTLTLINSGNYTTANRLLAELVALADEKGAAFWKARGMALLGCVLAATGKASEAVQMITAGIAAWQSTGSTIFMPWHLSNLTRAYGELGQFDDAWCCIDKAIAAIETTNERWFEAELHRIAGEIALMSPEPDPAKAEAYFQRALAVARAQQAKSWGCAQR